MNSQYYYFDADSQTVCGPFGLQDVWALHERRTLLNETLICRAGFEEWQPLGTFPELLPAPVLEKPAPPALSLPPRPEERLAPAYFFEPSPALAAEPPAEFSPPVLSLPPRPEAQPPPFEESLSYFEESLPPVEEPPPLNIFPERLPPPVLEAPAALPPTESAPPPRRVSAPGRSRLVPIAAAVGGFLAVSGICYFSLAERNHAADAVLIDPTVPSSAILPDHSWDDGYSDGFDLGKANTQRGLPVPAADALHADAILASQKVHPLKEDLWAEGYEEGFAAGCKEVTKPSASSH